MHKLCNFLFDFSDKILDFAQKFEKIKNKFPEIIVLIIFPVLYWFFGIFHEPWFDEAQAWQIAKCATYHDILFYLPHMEGHPPLWHLLLSVFAKNNFPYEITIKSVSFLFSYIAVFFIVLKSPFYRIIKLLLPFTYFLFYQHTIISRPYCLVMLGFCLLALFYEERFQKPFKYGFALVFLSLCHAFCFIIASFLTLVWFFEAIKNKNLKTKNIAIFALLLIFYIVLAISIFPSKEASGLNLIPKNNIFERLLYTFLIIPSNCLISSIYNDLYLTKYSICDIVFGSFVGMFFWYFVYFFTKNKKDILLTFLLPYAIFAIIATKYFSHTHLGTVFCFIVFICWIFLNSDTHKTETKNSELIKKCFILFVFFSLLSNLYWSLKSCVLDVFITYSIGKKEARFIKKNNLDKYKIMVEWIFNDDVGNPNFNGTWLTISPYFKKNIFYNFNDLTPEKNYVFYKDISEKDVLKIYSRWKTYGKPDVILGNPPIQKVFPDIDLSDYVNVYLNNTRYIQKGMLLKEEIVTISVKKELAQKLHLEEVEPDLKNYKFDLYGISTYLFCKIFDFKNKFLEKIK